MMKTLCTAYAAFAIITIAASAHAGNKPLRDAPIAWYEDDRQPIELPAEREPSIAWDYFEDSWGQPRERLTNPVRITWSIGRLFGGDKVPPARNINALDEVPNSTWFTNRIGMYPMSPADVARGRGDGRGPDQSQKWEVVKAKTEGVTPGFNIRDGRGDVYVIKFDPPGYMNMTTAAGVISNRILHAFGYNVPEDYTVTFRRSDIVVAEGATMKGPDDTKRPMTERDIDEILDSVDMLNDSEWLAISSRYLSGRPVGPFSQRGRRKDDPNDRVNHEDRRELRGLYSVAAWINHFDLKQHNTLDMYVTRDGSSFIEHNLIDFASTLGAGASGVNRRYGYEYSFDPKAILRRTFTLGMLEDRWRKRERDAELTEVGYFDSAYLEANKFRPLQPQSDFANTTDRDAYWGAKIVGAFRDEHIDAIVAQGGYRDPRATEAVATVLKKNRDIIVRYYFDRVTPIDYFLFDGRSVRFRDLGEEYGVYPGTTARYRMRAAATNEDRGVEKKTRSEWTDLDAPSVSLTSAAVTGALSAPAAERPFLSLELQVDRGDGWSESVVVYLARETGRAIGRIVAVDR